MPASRARNLKAGLALLLAFVLLGAPLQSSAYSVLTHEQIIDFLWESNIQKLLLERYPSTTPEGLRRAHAFAYGGSLIQDMGYYPGGTKFYTDLVHYVRSGEFVEQMIEQARDVNELAFALGALAHYVSDINGHPAVNQSVPKEFPKLRKKFGDVITYCDDPPSHIQTEFGFDVLEVAKQRYTSQEYHDFIGFEVAQPLLNRAFAATYDLDLQKVFSDEDRAIGSYRHAVAVWVPRLTQVALLTKKDDLQAIPNFNARKFRYTLKRAEYEREWGTNYYRPSFFARVLAVVIKIIPKIGPLRAINPKPPTPETEKMYIASVEKTVAAYRKALIAVEQRRLSLADEDLDVGHRTIPGDYKLADRAYARLLKEHARNHFANLQPDLRANLLAFYSDLNQPLETKRHKDEWKHLLENLDALKHQPASLAHRQPQ
jgi:hypothetical protein